LYNASKDHSMASTLDSSMRGKHAARMFASRLQATADNILGTFLELQRECQISLSTHTTGRAISQWLILFRLLFGFGLFVLTTGNDGCLDGNTDHDGAK
jgi:hypothetical protein